MNLETKLQALDYIVDQLKSWYVEAGGDLVQNDLSKLKVTKLLFFISAVSSSRETPGLLTTFDDFVAMPFGHVESELHDHMDESAHFAITKDALRFKPGMNQYIINEGISSLQPVIDSSIVKLKKINHGLVKYHPFTLVDLSHKWQSWNTIFSLAKRNGKYSMKIPKEMIMVEPKIFHI